METAGLAVGVVALASAFNNAVNCFEYVQLARTFGQSFQTSLIQLDAAKLRLTRWGASIGIAEINDEHSLAQTRLPSEQIAQAQITLGQVDLLFKQAKEFSSSYQLAGGPPPTSFHEPANDLDAQHLSLHDFMWNLSLKRQGTLNLTKKVKWALRDERRLKSLLGDITDLVDTLVEAFPAAREVQRQLCATEVAEMNSGNNLATLRAAVGDWDQMLSDAIAKELRSSAWGMPNISNVWHGTNNQGFQLGYNAGTIGYHYGGNVK